MIAALTLLTASSIPATIAEDQLRTELVAFATNRLGDTVGNGQCADLISKGLDSINAQPFGTFQDFPAKGDYVWGKKIAEFNQTNPPTDLAPGTILQFRDVKLVIKSGYATMTYTAKQHTAIIESFNPTSGQAIVLQQNSQNRHFVTRDTLNLSAIRSGKIWAYVPAP